MCDIGEFKLCTCSGSIDENEPHWILEKLSINKNEINEVIIGLYRFEYLHNVDYVLEKLNTSNPFDFDYKPSQKDILTINFEDVGFTFIYTNKKWRIFDDKYICLEDHQKQFKNNGKILLSNEYKDSQNTIA